MINLGLNVLLSTFHFDTVRLPQGTHRLGLISPEISAEIKVHLFVCSRELSESGTALRGLRLRSVNSCRQRLEIGILLRTMSRRTSSCSRAPDVNNKATQNQQRRASDWRRCKAKPLIEP